MKTLDEVITVLDGCFLKSRKEWCVENCPYLQNDEQTCRRDVLNDALHYLKEYQTTQMAYIKAMADLEDNPPLTWAELRTMEGKPIWIDSVPLVRRWVIIKKFHPIGGNKNLFDMEVEDGAHFLRKNMRRDDPAWWQAYRKEKS